MRKILLPSVLILLLFPFSVIAQRALPNRSVDIPVENDPENLSVFQQWLKWNNPGSLLLYYLDQQAVEFYNERDRDIAALRDASDWQRRQAEVKKKLAVFFGSVPEAGPVSAQITGVIKRDGYRIEKIVYQSFPGFYVTGCLYVPEKLKGRAPVVLNVIGHNQEAFRNSLYQVINYNLVKKGIMVFAIDPPGQGEHVQYWDPAVKFSLAGYSVLEHCYFGNHCFLSGFNCARYFIWDGMRAIDYLVSRKDVDPSRIGVTGFSGGGTITSYIAAWDERVKVSIPCSWATASRRQLETKGGQDAEAEFINMVSEKISFEDLLEVRAPKPTLLTFTSRDEYLCLQGAREAFREAGNAYSALGNPANIEMVEDDSKHWMTLKIREKMYAFIMKHFNMKGDSTEREAEILTNEELTVTPTGQIASSFGGKMIFDLNLEESGILFNRLERARLDIAQHLKETPGKAREISGYIEPSVQESEPFINGRYRRNGYTVGKYTIMGEGPYPVPYLLFMPDDSVKNHYALIYLNPKGKAADALPGGEIEKLVRKGYIVAAADLPGYGELTNTAARGITDGYTALMIGRSVVAIDAGDIVRLACSIKNLPGVDQTKIGAVAVSELCIPLLHAAAFNEVIRNVTLINPLVSFRSVVENRRYKIGLTPREGGNYWHPHEIDFTWGVAGALQAYDLPDLMGCIAPRRLTVCNAVDQELIKATKTMTDRELSFAFEAYRFKGASENLLVTQDEKSIVDLAAWSFKSEK